MSKVEFVSPEGLRIDGRRPLEVRRIRCELGQLERADGSAYYEQGNTRIIAAVFGPRALEKRSEARHDRGVLHVEISTASFSTGERRQQLRGDRRAAELAQLVKDTFEEVLLLEQFPQSQIDIFLQIVQVDGGKKAACINAANLALIDAGIPMIDFVCACHAGYVDNTPIVDLNYTEECSNSPDLPVALLPNSGTLKPDRMDDLGEQDGDHIDSLKIVSMQLDKRVPLDLLPTILRVASEGALQIYAVLKEQVRDHAMELARKAGTRAV